MTMAPPQRRRFSTRALIIAGVALVSVATAVVISTNRPARVSGKAPVIAPTGRSDATAVLDPASFSDDQQRHAYMAAREIPAMLNQLYCWCHCRENMIFHHRSLLECFESDHASQCGICMGEAMLAHTMVKQGITDVRQIQDAIDARFGPQARGST